jgi:Ca-activated chloride channel homolog
LDTSGSMNTRDVRPTRAAAAARAVRSFVDATAAGTRIGLVSFAGEAQPLSAPTNDRSALHSALTHVPEPNGQTAIGAGLSAAAAMLPERGARAIVLMTDGANNHGEDPRNVVGRLAAAHIRLDAIAIGDASAEHALRSYATQTGGIFARAGDAEELDAQMRRLASMRLSVRVSRDCTVRFVAIALCLGAAACLAAAGAGTRF